MKLRGLRRIGSNPGELNSNVIVVENLSKKFRIPHERKLTVYENIIGLLRGGSYIYEELQVLNHISFTIKRGETFGVIGPNGSGKSTLLKVLAGVLYPDCGSIKLNGKVSPFLELGIGFQPDLTAKENIFLYGAIMGLARRQIEERYEKILDFAELKRFENMKLKNFSSGMYVRLGFSTAIQTDPDIMLVDEVLSVGDESFQKKCGQKIDEIRRAGKTILLVSHELGTVKQLCGRCLLMNQGRVMMLGDTEKVLEEYTRIRQETGETQT